MSQPPRTPRSSQDRSSSRLNNRNSYLRHLGRPTFLSGSPRAQYPQGYYHPIDIFDRDNAYEDEEENVAYYIHRDRVSPSRSSLLLGNDGLTARLGPQIGCTRHGGILDTDLSDRASNNKRVGISNREFDTNSTAADTFLRDRRALRRAWLSTATEILAIIFLFLAVAVLGFYAGWALGSSLLSDSQQVDDNYWSRTRNTSGAFSILPGLENRYNSENAMIDVLFNGSLFKENVFRGPAGPETDDAWEAIGVNCMRLFISSILDYNEKKC